MYPSINFLPPNNPAINQSILAYQLLVWTEFEKASPLISWAATSIIVDTKSSIYPELSCSFDSIPDKIDDVPVERIPGAVRTDVVAQSPNFSYTI